MRWFDSARVELGKAVGGLGGWRPVSVTSGLLVAQTLRAGCHVLLSRPPGAKRAAKAS